MMISPMTLATAFLSMPRLLVFTALMVCFTTQASAQDRLINNGLAPPNPENVVNEDLRPFGTVYTRNVGCGEPGDVSAPCTDPGAATRTRADADAFVIEWHITESSSSEIAGGIVGTARLTQQAGLRFTGGVIGTISTRYESVVEIDGGLASTLNLAGNSVVRWTGGPQTLPSSPTFNPTLYAREASRVYIEGSDFRVNGVPVDLGLIAATAGTLTGTLSNGAPLLTDFAHNGNGFRETGQVILTPEPTTGILVGLGVALLARRGRPLG